MKGGRISAHFRNFRNFRHSVVGVVGGRGRSVVVTSVPTQAGQVNSNSSKGLGGGLGGLGGNRVQAEWKNGNPDQTSTKVERTADGQRMDSRWIVSRGCGEVWRVSRGCGEVWRQSRRCAEVWIQSRRCAEVWREKERCGEVWREKERCGEKRRGVEKCEEMNLGSQVGKSGKGDSANSVGSSRLVWQGQAGRGKVVWKSIVTEIPAGHLIVVRQVHQVIRHTLLLCWARFM